MINVTLQRRLQRRIFAACRELGLDADARHDLQLITTGKESLREMDEGELEAVLAALAAKGFRQRPKGRHPLAPRRDLRLVHVLWKRLGEAGVLERPDRAGLNAFIRSQFGAAWGSVPADVDMLRDADQINAVIQAQKAMAERAGVSIER